MINSFPAAHLRRHRELWLLDGEARKLSAATLGNRRFLLDKLQWWLADAEHTEVCKASLRGFLAYVNRGHLDPRGRWGDPRQRTEVSSSTAKSYFTILATFCDFLVAEEILDASPMASMAPPVHRDDQIQPFTAEQCKALLRAAKSGPYRIRDRALLLLMLDTGARASEVCGLDVGDVDRDCRYCVVHGKGDKDRQLPFGVKLRRAMFSYLRDIEGKESDEPLFTSARGRTGGSRLTRSGLLQLVERLGKEAGIEAVRCSPHTFRHTFAVNFLRGGGGSFTLQVLLGHTSLAMTQKYVALAQADVTGQHRTASPGDRLDDH